VRNSDHFLFNKVYKLPNKLLLKAQALSIYKMLFSSLLSFWNAEIRLKCSFVCLLHL